MERIGFRMRLQPGREEEYRRRHAAVWPELLADLKAAGASNYSIFLREPENLLFATFEYHGTDYAADMEKMRQHEPTQRWWAIHDPMQEPLATRAEGEHWAMMDEVFHVD